MAMNRRAGRYHFDLGALALPIGITLLALTLPGVIVVFAKINEAPRWFEIMLTAICSPGFLVGLALFCWGIRRRRLTRWSRY